LMTAAWVDIHEWISLVFIGVSLAVGIYISLIKMKKPTNPS
jgi:tellurite resistance protein TerC